MPPEELSGSATPLSHFLECTTIDLDLGSSIACHEGAPVLLPLYVPLRVLTLIWWRKRHTARA